MLAFRIVFLEKKHYAQIPCIRMSAADRREFGSAAAALITGASFAQGALVIFDLFVKSFSMTLFVS